jgi:Delta3-Delta2-enoyl-CoA isomerase
VSYQTIETEIRDGVMVLRQNRPNVLNARNSLMYIEIMAALAEASDDQDVAAVMLTGRGRLFCAGMDMRSDFQTEHDVLPTDSKWLVHMKTNQPKHDNSDVRTWLATAFITSFVDFDKPIVGAVNGPAVGEGFTSLLHCDLIYATPSTYFWAPFGRAGVVPEFCSTLLMPKRLGVSLANAAICFGRRITVEEAHRAGFVLEVLPTTTGAEFEESVLAKISEGMALMGPPALRAATMKSFRDLVYPGSEKELLRDRCIVEMELLKGRLLRGDLGKVQQYYQSQLPKR